MAHEAAHALEHALALSGSMTWEILWALILGFTLSAVVQAVVCRSTIVSLLGDDRPRTLAVAAGLGAASSSCSYAAVALARSLFRKGANFTAAMAFEIGKNISGSALRHAAVLHQSSVSIPAHFPAGRDLCTEVAGSGYAQG